MIAAVIAMHSQWLIFSVTQTHSLDSLRVSLTGQSRLTAKIHSVKPINQQSMPQ
ncbi:MULTISPECIES: hypothetical protein [Pantoea]|uniref:hypothetical protein n=1 Tax=Pantoea TaxID=53335 RepID=UPI0012D34D47|nr:hypothetical protein [Pantoea ananatis]MCW0332504.1 hypothetical protein [Pantoea ananatis]